MALNTPFTSGKIKGMSGGSSTAKMPKKSPKAPKK